MGFRLEGSACRNVRGPGSAVILGVLESLPRDGHVILASMDAAEVFIQVWHRPDGSYQLETRNGSAASHVQTRSISREKVADAFSAWLGEKAGEGDASWRAAFQWNDISGMFAPPHSQ
jgi:hypothetical protein